MRASELDRLITVQRAPKPWTPNAVGQRAPVWAEYFRPWAAVRHMSATEVVAANQVAGSIDTLFRLRYDSVSSTITNDESFRILYEGRYYDIKASFEAPPPAPRRSEWHILAVARSE